MPRAAHLVLAASTSLHLACDPAPEPDGGPVESIAPEGLVEVTEFRGVARIGEPSAWRNGPPLAAGDIDGDGLDDLVVARWRDVLEEQSTEEETRIIYGTTPPPAQRSSFAASGPAIQAVHVPGSAAVPLGDIDGDGDGEIVAGDFTEPLFLGGSRLSGDVDSSAADLEIHALLPHRFFAAGDIDGDGDGDVGVLVDSTSLGVWLGGPDVLGAAGSTQPIEPQIVPIRGTADGERYFGVHRTPGDLDGDGMDDLVYMLDDEGAGTWGIEIVYGRADFTNAPESTPDAKLVPDAYQELAGLGDFDGDGRADILAHTHAGDVALILSSAVGAPRIVGEHVFSDLSLTVAQGPLVDLAWAGDIDADGTDDIVGMRDEAEGISLLLWYGTVGATNLPDGPDATISFPRSVTGSPSDVVGTSAFALTGIGDLDGNGYGDFAATTDGTLWLFHGGPRRAARP